MMDFGDKGVFAVPVVMMNLGDRGVFVRIPFHPDTLFFWAFYAVRVKGGKSLRNGMRNGVRNGIIMRNTIYAGNKLTEERVMFSRQFYKSSSFFDAAYSC